MHVFSIIRILIMHDTIIYNYNNGYLKLYACMHVFSFLELLLACMKNLIVKFQGANTYELFQAQSSY